MKFLKINVVHNCDSLGVVCLLRNFLHGLCLSDVREDQRITMAYITLCNVNYETGQGTLVM